MVSHMLPLALRSYIVRLVFVWVSTIAVFEVSDKKEMKLPV
jgi:hypothetical protein